MTTEGFFGRASLRAAGAALVVAGFSACAHKQIVPAAPPPSSKTAEGPKEPVPQTPPPVETGEAVIRGGEFTEIPELKQIHFAFDNYSLDEDARATLKANADYLKEHESLDVLVAGNCDERGTVEYNLALGQRRAKAVRDYYVHLGVAAKSVATISYGKEKPLCSESTEACWAKNRRAETRVRARVAAGPPGQGDAGQGDATKQ